MPSFSILHDISAELQAQIVASLNSAADIGFVASTTNIVIDPPSEDLADEVLACLYLYHVALDPHLRNQPKLGDPSDASLFIRPPIPLLVRYLFVPLSDSTEKDQLMLGRVVQHFHDAPTFKPIPGSSLAKNRGGVPEELRVRPDLSGFEALSTLWSALAQPYRLSAGFLVDIVAVDSARPSRRMTRAETSYGRMRDKEPEATP